MNQKLLARWFKAQSELQALKKQEMELRLEVFATYFTNPTEGNNAYPLPNNYQLNAKHTINRKVDAEMLQALRPQMDKLLISPGLFKYNPTLVISEYRNLAKTQLHQVDQALTISEGTPSLEIILKKD